MPKLATVGRRFQSTFQLLNGRQFLGIIDTPADRQMPSYQFTYPRRILRTGMASMAKVGDIMRAPNGAYYLLSDNDEGMVYDTRLYKTFRLFTLDQELPWSRPRKGTDPLTGVEVEQTAEDLGTIRCALEALKEDVDRVMHIYADRFHIITNVDLQMNDVVGGRVVKRLNPNLGVMFAEVQ